WSWSKAKRSKRAFAAMDHCRFRGGQRARRLFDYFERERKRQWSIAANARFERFAFDQLHDIKTLAILFAVVSDTRNIRVSDLCGRARFAQKTRSDSGHFRDPSVYDFESDDGIQNRVTRTISNRDCS